jgi:hypothetical protein
MFNLMQSIVAKVKGFGLIMASALSYSAVLALTSFAMSLIWALPVMLLWNAVVPSILDTTTITFGQSLCLLMLSHSLLSRHSMMPKKESVAVVAPSCAARQVRRN